MRISMKPEAKENEDALQAVQKVTSAAEFDITFVKLKVLNAIVAPG